MWAYVRASCGRPKPPRPASTGPGSPAPPSAIAGRAPDGHAERSRKLVRPGREVNRAGGPTCAISDVFCARSLCEEMDKRAPRALRLSSADGCRKRPVLGLEGALDAGEDLERAVQGGVVMGGHDARAQERSAGRHRGMQG